MIKKVYLLGIISVFFASCSKNEVPTESVSSVKQESMAIDFKSYDVMDARIDEIIAIKAQKEIAVLKTYDEAKSPKLALSGNLIKVEKEKIEQNAMIKDLVIYHTEKLKSIYELRAELNFTSIQSIVEEINSLGLTNPGKATSLFEKNKKFLKKTKFEVQTIFDDRIANVINEKGEVKLKGEILDFDKSDSKASTGRYIYDEDVKAGTAVLTGDTNTGAVFYVNFYAGREYHKNDFGVGFYRNFTEFKAYIRPQSGLPFVACPTTFAINPGSQAGFVNVGSSFFCEYTFSMEYPSGYGVSVRNSGGKRNCKFSPNVSGVGGSFKGQFRVNFNNGYFVKNIDCDVKYPT
jgi:hypothetical protein